LVRQKTSLQLRCVAVEYADFPAIEWTLYFKNTGDKNTPILENIQGLDAAFQRGDGGEFVLRSIRGDINRTNSYEPYRKSLKPGTIEKFAAAGGWGTCGNFPCYNLQMPGEGYRKRPAEHVLRAVIAWSSSAAVVAAG
jgi:alpha-galactosidase